MEMAMRPRGNENPCIRIIKDGVAPGDFRNVDVWLAASHCRRL
jgi:hypothetical protein